VPISDYFSLIQQGEFRCTAKAIYQITEEGRKLARWDAPRPSNGLLHSTNSPNASQANLHSRPSAELEGGITASEIAFGPGASSPHPTNPSIAQTTDAKIHRRISMAEKLRTEFRSGEAGANAPKESNTDRLKHILDEPALRSLFREFLRGNFCEENLSFWLDVQDFKRRFSTTSSAIATPSNSTKVKATPGQAAMEKHHEALITMAFVIYNTYLAPSSPCELNIDHSLRSELVTYLNEVLTETTGKAFQGRVEPDQANAFNATQLQTMIRLYERIQTHVFRLMATDSVPKVRFILPFH